MDESNLIASILSIFEQLAKNIGRRLMITFLHYPSAVFRLTKSEKLVREKMTKCDMGGGRGQKTSFRN